MRQHDGERRLREQVFHQKWISLLSEGPWNSRTVVPSAPEPPRSADDTSPPQVIPLPGRCDGAPVSGLRSLLRGLRDGDNRQREVTEPRGDHDPFRVGRRHFQGDGPRRLRFRAFRCGALDQLPVDGKDAHIVQHRLAGYAARGRNVVAVLRLGQDQIDAVARPDQAGEAGDRIDADGDGTHAGPEHRRQKTAVARIERVADQQYIALGQVAPDQGAEQVAASGFGVGPGAGGTSFADRCSAARSSGFNSVPARNGPAAISSDTMSVGAAASVAGGGPPGAG